MRRIAIAALASANFPVVQNCPSLWTAVLALNPLDSMRVGQLLSAGGVPFDATRMPWFVQGWLGHLGLCFSIVSAGWILVGLGWSHRRLQYVN